MHTSRLGGSIASEDIAVAVIPIGVPSTHMVMTFTVDATRRIAWRNRSVGGAAAGSIASQMKRGGEIASFDGARRADKGTA